MLISARKLKDRNLLGVCQLLPLSKVSQHPRAIPRAGMPVRYVEGNSHLTVYLRMKMFAEGDLLRELLVLKMIVNLLLHL